MLDLLERFVSAFEKLAQAQEDLAGALTPPPAGLPVYDVRAAGLAQKPEPEVETPEAPDPEPERKPVLTDDWNPVIEPMRSRYSAEQSAAMKAWLDEHGVTYNPSDPGGKLHQAVKAKASEKEPPKTAKAAEPEPAQAPAVPEDVAAAFKAAEEDLTSPNLLACFAAARKHKAIPELQAVLGNFVPSRKLADVDPGAYGEVLHALKGLFGVVEEVEF